MLKNKLRVKLFTHTDLDGRGCSVLCKLTFEKVDVSHCNYDDINKKVREFIESKDYENYDLVLITDISVDAETAELINNTHPEKFAEGFNLGEIFQLLDHHPNLTHLDKYFWANVEVFMEDGHKSCGTYLLWKYLYEHEYIDKEWYSNFVELVRRYDTWEWEDIYNDRQAYNLNMLLGNYGPVEFEEVAVERLTNSDWTYSKEEQELIKKEEIKRDAYLKARLKKVYHKIIGDSMVSICFAEDYINDLTRAMMDANPSSDYSIVVNMGTHTVSYRTTRSDIDLTAIAESFGGGGHRKASGSRVSSDLALDFLDKIFQR